MLGIFLMIFFFVGCGAIGDFLSSRVLKDDLRGLAARHDVALSLSECRMIPETRTGICRTRIDDLQIHRLRRGWKLSGPNEGEGNTRASLHPDGCLALEGFDEAAGLEIDVSPPRSPDLPGFEHIAVLRDPTSGRTCVEAVYAGG